MKPQGLFLVLPLLFISHIGLSRGQLQTQVGLNTAFGGQTQIWGETTVIGGQTIFSATYTGAFGVGVAASVQPLSCPDPVT